ncbi:MAG: DNA repair protein RecN [Proteobacteria bacterium]|nr:MAG: DNA repair protein RecN [Pseudomonadota bacterium]
MLTSVLVSSSPVRRQPASPAQQLMFLHRGIDPAMITQLTIRGLAIIEELHIDFSPRLNVITGETGAGKSILIKALHLLLGAKADAEVIRNGFDKAFVSARFLLPRTHPAVEYLNEHGLWHDEHDLTEIILRREITNKNRSQAWMNDQSITQTTLKELGQNLIDIYGQHENHRMLDPATHIDYIDQFLDKPQLRNSVIQQMTQVSVLYQDIRKRLEQFLTRRREQDYLQFRFKELEEFEPSAENYADIVRISSEAQQYMQEQKVLQQLQTIQDESYNGKSLSAAVRDLLRLSDGSKLIKGNPEMMAVVDQLRDVGSIFDEFSYHVGRIVDDQEISEEELESHESRLAEYQRLFRKLGVRSIEEMMEEYERLDQQLSYVRDAPDELADKIRSLLKQLQDIDKTGRQLSVARHKAADQARKKIESELHDLNMSGAKINFEFQPVKQSIPDLDLLDFDEETKKNWAKCVDILTENSRHGREKGQFLLAANPGEGFKPLAKVASGGEISRIMLGFKKILSAGANTCVMVFDEIDTGISGHTADIVGSKLKGLSDAFQVICISHLAQVAAYGDAHFKVEKLQKKGSTESNIFRLDGAQSESEIARLLSGSKLTASSLQNARQLITSAQKGPGREEVSVDL